MIRYRRISSRMSLDRERCRRNATETQKGCGSHEVLMASSCGLPGVCPSKPVLALASKSYGAFAMLVLIVN